MEKLTLKDKLSRYIDAGFPVIYLNTFEEEKIDSIIKDLPFQNEIYEWNEINGFIDFNTGTPLFGEFSLEMTLDSLKEPMSLDNKIIILKDIASYLEDPKIVSKIKGLIQVINREDLDVNATIFIVSSILLIPKELEKYITILEVDYLEHDEIKKIVLSFLKDYSLRISEELLEEFTIALKGLTEFEINNLLALAYSNDGELTRSDLRLIFDQKQQMIKKAGILEMIPLKESIDDIGGLENLKDWFSKKAKIFKNISKAQRFGVDIPKGVLIAGVPGCGKSLNAKAAANLFEVPLLRLDMGNMSVNPKQICEKQFLWQRRFHLVFCGLMN